MNNIPESLLHAAADVLLQRQAMLATAESCTGGWIAQSMTALAGSSAWFERGFVTYSNAAKQEMLGVTSQTLQTHGAVSEAVVLEMARGAVQRSRAQYSIAVSGIAGPGGAVPGKPVGTVWLGWAYPVADDSSSHARCIHFDGNREHVRCQTVIAALRELVVIAETTA